MIKRTAKKIKSIAAFIKNARKKDYYKPLYKLVDIYEEKNEYYVIVKIINKSTTYPAKPEEILADDKLVDQFSPRDVRALTYLGYLGINSPKYKILAKKLFENDKIAFILSEKGNNEPIIKTADEIIQEASIIHNMDSEDAKTVGFIAGSENLLDEKKQKQDALKNSNGEN